MSRVPTDIYRQRIIHGRRLPMDPSVFEYSDFYDAVEFWWKTDGVDWGIEKIEPGPKEDYQGPMYHVFFQSSHSGNTLTGTNLEELLAWATEWLLSETLAEFHDFVYPGAA